MGVEFNEPSYEVQRPAKSAQKQGFLVALVMRLGLAKDEDGATKVLLFVLAVTVMLTIIVLILSGREALPPTPPL